MKGDSTPFQGAVHVGIDVGGTFTDLVAYDEGTRTTVFLKVHTTPTDPSEGVFEAFQQLKASHARGAVKRLVHATTIATNTLLQKRGAKTCLLTTRGFEDVLEIRRHNRPQMYNLFQEISPPLVPRRLRLGIAERIDARGDVLSPLDKSGLLEAIERMEEEGIESVAISFLHSYRNPLHEEEAREEILAHIPQAFVSCSHDVWPEFREYERTSTTVLNAYIRPSVDTYLERMGKRLSQEGVGSFSVMKSNGGLSSYDNARRFPVHLLESGPAAGMVSAAWLGKGLGIKNMIALDVGGTTAKAGIVTRGAPKVTTEFHADSVSHGTPVGGYPIRSPVIDLVEIGAGGGSVGWIDEAGILKVGPRSAGAVPGPACYGTGGNEPTFTDANLVLGYLDPENFHGGRTKLYRELAEKAIYDKVARFFGWSLEKAASAMVRIGRANLMEMVRLVSIQKGLDPRDFSLLAYGGAGPLHASTIAKDLNIRRTIVPPLAGVFSALGLLVAGVKHDLVRTRPYLTDEISPSEGPKAFADLKGQMTDLLKREGSSWSRVSMFRSVDMRYLGQVFELTVPIDGELGDPEEVRLLERKFEEKYKAAFHYSLPGSRVEIVNFRLTATIGDAVPGPDNLLKRISASTEERGEGVRRVFHGSRNEYIEVPVFRNGGVRAGGQIPGPALIDTADTTIFILEDQKGLVDERGCLVIESK